MKTIYKYGEYKSQDRHEFILNNNLYYDYSFQQSKEQLLRNLKSSTGARLSERSAHVQSFNDFPFDIAYHPNLEHPNIVQFYEAYEDDNCFYVVFVAPEGKPLSDCLEFLSYVNDKTKSTILSQILFIVNYLHSIGLMHRNLNPEVFYFEERSLSVSLIDCGTCLPVSDCRLPINSFIMFSAPEMFNQKYYCKSVDIWSIGIFAHIILYGVEPYETDQFTDLKYLVCKMKVNKNPKKIDKVAQEFVNLCLQTNPELRQDVQTLLSHDFIANYSYKPSRKSIMYNTNLSSLLNFNKKQKIANYIGAYAKLYNLENIKNTFNQIDLDKNGFIDFEELKQGLSILLPGGASEAERKCTEIFSHVDDDNNQAIDFNEFVVLTFKYDKKSIESLNEAFMQLATEDSHYITVDDLCKVFKIDDTKIKQELTDLVLESDSNNDGLIQKEEFLKMMCSSIGVEMSEQKWYSEYRDKKKSETYQHPEIVRRSKRESSVKTNLVTEWYEKYKRGEADLDEIVKQSSENVSTEVLFYLREELEHLEAMAIHQNANLITETKEQKSSKKEFYEVMNLKEYLEINSGLKKDKSNLQAIDNYNIEIQEDNCSFSDDKSEMSFMSNQQ